MSRAHGTIEIDVELSPDGPLEDVLAVMHRAFAEYSALGAPSGALLETVVTLREEMQGDLRIAAARVDGVVRGMVKYAPSADGTLYFSRLAVDPAARGRGVAGALVRVLRAQALKEGRAGLSCAVRDDTPENVELYRHLGMEIVARETRTSLTGAVLPIVLMRDEERTKLDGTS